MFWDQAISLAFFLLPALYVVYCWKWGSITTSTVSMVVFGILASLGSGKIIPMFCVEVAGGSTFIPATFVLLALVAKKYSNKAAFDALNVVTFALLLFSVAQARWWAFSFFTPEETTHTFRASELAFKNALLTTILIYISGLFLLSARKAPMDVKPIIRTWVPVFLDILLTMPISLLSVYWMQGNNPDVITESLVVSTIMVRMIIPIGLLAYVLWDTRGK